MKLPWSKPAAPEEPAPVATPAAVVEPIDPTAPKGRPTPKRRDAQPRRSGPVAPPPATGKEARARQKELAAERKAKGLPEPERRAERESRVAARDAGPERALVRNIVDSRFSLGSIFPIFAILVLVVTFSGLQSKNVQLYNIVTTVWLVFFVFIVAESLWIARKVGKVVRERFPKTKERMGSLKFYAIMRSLMFRKGRYPKPVVKTGEPY